MKKMFSLCLLLAACTGPLKEPEFAGAWRCGPETVFDAWRLDETLRLDFFRHEYELTQVPATSGVRYESEDVQFDEKGNQALLWLNGERRQCRLDESVMSAIERGVDYRAIGQEPGWLLEIDEGEQIRLEYDYAQRSAMLPYREPEGKDGESRYASKTEDKRIEVDIMVAPCRDAMSGQPYPDTVTVRFEDEEVERVLNGCGRPLPKMDSRHSPD